MNIYVLIFLLLILLRFSLSGKPRLRTQVYYIVLAALFVFSAFRFEVGCDWSGYYNQWQIQKAMPAEFALANREPTWWLSMYVFQKLGLAYPTVNILSAGLFFLGLHSMARRQADPLGVLVLAFPLLIVMLGMTAIRQAAALGIMFIAFNAYIDKRLVRFVFLTIFASTIHNSAMILLLLAPMVPGRFSKRRVALAALLAIPGLLLLLSSSSAELAQSRYVDSDTNAAGSLFRVGLVFLSGVLFLVFLARRWKLRFPGDYEFVTVNAVLMLALLPMVSVSTVIADRFSYYLLPAQITIFARIPELRLAQWRTEFFVLPYILLAIFFTVWTSMSWHFEQCYLPYQSWLNDVSAMAQTYE